jgi:hypothetical protein
MLDFFFLRPKYKMSRNQHPASFQKPYGNRDRRNPNASGDSYQEFVIRTTEKVPLPVTEAWDLAPPPRVEIPLDRRDSHYNRMTTPLISIGDVPMKKLSGFQMQYSENWILSMGRFFGRMLSVAKYEIAEGLSHIRGSFVGIEAPPGIKQVYKNGNLLRENGSVELFRFHFLALRCIRDQMLPVGMGRRPNELTNLGKCPFGDDCIFQMYSYVVAHILAEFGPNDPLETYVERAARGQEPLMERYVLKSKSGCRCPFIHDESAVSTCERFSEKIFDAAKEEFVRILWCRANGLAINSPYGIPTAKYSTGQILRGDYAQGRICATMLANFDNFGGVHPLFNNVRGPFASDGILRDVVEREYVEWIKTRSTNDRPYGLFQDPLLLSNIKVSEDPAKNKSKITMPNVGNGKINVEVEDSEAKPAPAPVPVPTLAPAALAPSPLAASASAPVFNFDTSFIPRMVSDEFLLKEGFDRSIYDTLNPIQADSYVLDRIRILFKTHLLRLDSLAIENLARRVMEENYRDPTAIFESGLVYVTLVQHHVGSHAFGADAMFM